MILKQQLLVALLIMSVVTMASAQGSDQPESLAPISAQGADASDTDMDTATDSVKETKKEVRSSSKGYRKDMRRKQREQKVRHHKTEKHKVKKHHTNPHPDANPDGTLGEGP